MADRFTCVVSYSCILGRRCFKGQKCIAGQHRQENNEMFTRRELNKCKEKEGRFSFFYGGYQKYNNGRTLQSVVINQPSKNDRLRCEFFFFEKNVSNKYANRSKLESCCSSLTFSTVHRTRNFWSPSMRHVAPSTNTLVLHGVSFNCTLVVRLWSA
jgi:hypothetical protein